MKLSQKFMGPMRTSHTLFAFLTIAMLQGCGGPTPNSTATGTITFQGKPLAQANVVFSPIDENKKGNATSTNDSGQFNLKLFSGKYNVLVRKFVDAEGKVLSEEALDPTKSVDVENKPLSRNIVPERYSSPLTPIFVVDIAPGQNDLKPFSIDE